MEGMNSTTYADQNIEPWENENEMEMKRIEGVRVCVCVCVWERENNMQIYIFIEKGENIYGSSWQIAYLGQIWSLLNGGKSQICIELVMLFVLYDCIDKSCHDRIGFSGKLTKY